eukprot:CAMPEP_0203902276 /NCGR_PEP_ID=MMETSP0359-20131031/44341_1 /ASSEMBLY_ACC=CAM_ASM_000338 /TAXON_ID=268821 /ORGANISM="Scrippsiella Hangoei, Strain SHTV-5" /LENGTH=312 /DNA_ID=CAMNT_0050826089 /DNA_START=65 /DNA_END=1003 /DNA_ORIENTATION=+
MAILEHELAHPQLTEWQEDQLDRANLSSDLLDLWFEYEAQALQHSSAAVTVGTANLRLTHAERWEAAHMAHSALNHTGLAEKGVAWTEVLSVLDTCDAAWLARGASGRLGGQSLAVACLAVVSILAKSATHEGVQCTRFLTRPMEQGVHDQATVFLNLLQWRIHVPSLTTWVSTLSRRVAVLSPDLFEARIHLSENSALNFALGMIVFSAAFPRDPPRQLACGLVALCLAQTGAFDSHDLRPEDVWEKEWEHLLFNALSSPAPPARDPNFQVDVLLLAFGCELEQLQQACMRTLGLLRAAGFGGAPRVVVSI